MISVNHNNIELKFDEKKHIYYVEDIIFESVTSYIGNFFPKFNTQKESYKYSISHNIPQKKVIEMWNEEARIGSDFGTNVHFFAENYILGKKLPIPKNEKEKIYFKNVKKWLDIFLKYFDILDVEKIIFSPSLKIAGTFDLLVRNKKTKKKFLLDWKTNKKITFNNKWQNCICGFEKFEVSDIFKFTLQLNLYLYILKKELYCDRKDDINLKILYINSNGIQVLPIQKLKWNEIKILIKQRRNRWL